MDKFEELCKTLKRDRFSFVAVCSRYDGPKFRSFVHISVDDDEYLLLLVHIFADDPYSEAIDCDFGFEYSAVEDLCKDGWNVMLAGMRNSKCYHTCNLQPSALPPRPHRRLDAVREVMCLWSNMTHDAQLVWQEPPKTQ